MSRRDGFSSVSQRILPDGAERLVKAEAEEDKAEWERFLAADYAMRLLTSQLCSHLFAVLANYGLFALDDDKLLDWEAVEELQSKKLLRLFSRFSTRSPMKLPSPW